MLLTYHTLTHSTASALRSVSPAFHRLPFCSEAPRGWSDPRTERAQLLPEQRLRMAERCGSALRARVALRQSLDTWSRNPDAR